MQRVTFEPTFAGWRTAARALLASRTRPDDIAWDPGLVKSFDAEGAEVSGGRASHSRRVDFSEVMVGSPSLLPSASSASKALTWPANEKEAAHRSGSLPSA